MSRQTEQFDLIQEVRHAIFSLGEPLTEQKLSERFGVSRTPIREILQDLENLGVIERRQKKGVTVRKPSLKELAEVYDVRSVLEGYAARMAVANATPEGIRELAASASRFTRGRKNGDIQACEEANIAFHTKIIVMAGNDLLLSMMDQFNVIRRAFWLTHGLTWDDRDYLTPYPHEAIVGKLESGDTDGCDVLMQAHIRTGKNRLIEKAIGMKPAVLASDESSLSQLTKKNTTNF